MEQPHYFRPVLARIEFHHASQRAADRAVKEHTPVLSAAAGAAAALLRNGDCRTAEGKPHNCNPVTVGMRVSGAEQSQFQFSALRGFSAQYPHVLFSSHNVMSQADVLAELLEKFADWNFLRIVVGVCPKGEIQRYLDGPNFAEPAPTPPFQLELSLQ
jgi:hypothetical protein